jgi:hypothetical protein
MSRRITRKNVDVDVDTDPRWKSMLTDVHKAIDETMRKLDDLEQSAHVIAEKLKAGEPFPEREQLASRRAEHQPTNA